MQMATVKGRATTTVRHPSLNGQKILVCQLLGINGQPNGDPVLAVDRLGAGAGDKVILTSDGQGVRELLKDDSSPVRWWTAGIVD